jgi:hypothetical protein
MKPTDPESVVRDIKRKTRRKFSSEEKIRVVLEGLRGEASIAELYRREAFFALLQRDTLLQVTRRYRLCLRRFL